MVEFWQTAGNVFSASKASVLLVDDNPADLFYLRSVLEELDLTIVEVRSGEEALQHLAAHECAVVILDVCLPGLNGFQTAEAIRAIPRSQSTPILFVTASEVGRDDLERAYALGAVDFLIEPLLPIAVQAKVRSLVALFRGQQAEREAQQLRLLVQGTSEYAIFMLDPHGHVATWNTGAERIKGYRADEIIGQHFSKFYLQEAIDRDWPAYELQAAQRAGRFEDEGWRVRRDGSQFWANVIITALRDDTGKLLGFSKITRDLTERKNAEESARRLVEESTARRAAEESSRLIDEQRERLRVTLASIGDGVISTDAQGRVDFLNPIAEELTGWSSSEASGQFLSDVFHIVNEETRLPVENPALRALREGIIVGLANHTVLIARNGAEHPIDDSAAPIRSKDGTLIGCVLVFRDVSQRRADERALQDSELRYRLVGQAANDAIWDWDLATQEVIWNEGVHRVFGYAPQEVGSQASWWLENIHSEDRARITNDIHDAIDGGAEVWQNEYRFRRADGSYAIVFDRGRIVRKDGLPVRMVGSMLDLTERRSAEAALKAAEERFAFVRQSSGVGFWYCDLPFEVLQWDEQVKSHFHLPANATVTIETFYQQIHPADREPTRIAIEQSIEGRAPYDFVYRTVDSETNAVKWIRAIGRTFCADDGSPVRFDGVTIDVSKQKHAEAELREVAAALSEASHRKDEFLATLAHELRNPLAPLRNALQIMRLSSEPHLSQQALGMMERQLSQMVRLVDDLMDISRITRGKVDLRREQAPLSAVVSSAAETSHPLIEQMGQTLNVSLPAQAIMVDADVTRLAQVFANLLNNAAKYGERGGRIDLVVEPQDGVVTVRVRDSGIGIAPAQLHRIFELFTQLDRSLERSQGGLGIGLTLVKRLVEMHGGTVEARSEGHGKGSEFIVTLPLLPQNNPAAPASAATQSGNVRIQRRILVADDNLDSANSLAILLRVMGNEVSIVSDGLAAVEKAAKLRPDMVLLDIGMPNLNGLEACRRIREQDGGQQIVIVALTGWGQDEDRRLTLEAGFDLHLVKPVDPNVLERILAAPPTRSYSPRD